MFNFLKISQIIPKRNVSVTKEITVLSSLQTSHLPLGSGLVYELVNYPCLIYKLNYVFDYY